MSIKECLLILLLMIIMLGIIIDGKDIEKLQQKTIRNEQRINETLMELRGQIQQKNLDIEKKNSQIKFMVKKFGPDRNDPLRELSFKEIKVLAQYKAISKRSKDELQ